MDKINVKGLAFGVGIAWGISMILLGWVSLFGWGVKIVEVMSSFYIGFASSFLGGIIGGIWGFVDGAIGGAIIAIIYNTTTRQPKTQ